MATTKKKPTPRKKAPARKSAPRTPPEPKPDPLVNVADELPPFPPIPKDMDAPLDLDNLDEILRNHTFQLERTTRDLPELQRLESETRAARERVKHRVNQRLRDQSTAESKSFNGRFAKTSEALYSAEVELDEEWQAENARLREIRERIAEIGRLQTLFEHRRTVVRGLIELYASEYWGISDKVRDTVGRSDGTGPKRGQTGRREFKRSA